MLHQLGDPVHGMIAEIEKLREGHALIPHELRQHRLVLTPHAAGAAQIVHDRCIQIQNADKLGIDRGEIDALHAAAAHADGHAPTVQPELLGQEPTELRPHVGILVHVPAGHVADVRHVIAALEHLDLKGGKRPEILGLEQPPPRRVGRLGANQQGFPAFKRKIQLPKAEPLTLFVFHVSLLSIVQIPINAPCSRRRRCSSATEISRTVHLFCAARATASPAASPRQQTKGMMR